MEEALTILIPGDPVPWMRPGKGFEGRSYTQKEHAEYLERIALFGRQAMKGRPLFGCPLYVKVAVFKPIPESKSKAWKAAALNGEILPTCVPDADNYLKIALDGLRHVVFIDDCIVTDTFAKKRYSTDPFMKITVTPLKAFCHDITATEMERAKTPDLLRII